MLGDCSLSPIVLLWHFCYSLLFAALSRNVLVVFTLLLLYNLALLACVGSGKDEANASVTFAVTLTMDALVLLLSCCFSRAASLALGLYLRAERTAASLARVGGAGVSGKPRGGICGDFDNVTLGVTPVTSAALAPMLPLVRFSSSSAAAMATIVLIRACLCSLAPLYR